MTVALRPPRPTTANLLPALFARSWLKEQRLSDDGFCDSLATIQLSPSPVSYTHLTLPTKA